MTKMKGITCCGDCGYYNWKKHKCTRATDEGDARDKFYADCPLPDVIPVQEPRVMTLEEVKALPDESDVWLEEFCSIVVATTISHQPTINKVLKRLNPDVTYFYGIEHADYNSGEYMDADYGTEWRCWTSRPSDAQREATPWQ